jgi:hypothetical protein
MQVLILTLSHPQSILLFLSSLLLKTILANHIAFSNPSKVAKNAENTDSDHDSLYDPPLLPSPPLLLCDAPSDNTLFQVRADLEDTFDGLLCEMNSWHYPPASRSALTLTLSDCNKVGLTLFSEFASFG